MRRGVKNCKLVLTVFVGAIILLSVSSINKDNVLSASNTSADFLETSDSMVINVALYQIPHTFPFQEIFNYNWSGINQSYTFNLTIINKEDVMGKGQHSLTNENFDVFIIASSAKSYLFDSFNSRWRNNVYNFIENGGGYVGMCAGANIASVGFENPKNMFQRHINKGVLGLINVYIEDDFLGEWQYLLKNCYDPPVFDDVKGLDIGWGITVNTTIEKSEENIIFKNYEGNYRPICYYGGPGMYPADKSDPKLGDVIPILSFNEEPMYSKPLHYWKPTLNGWEIASNITTNLLGTYASVASIYNNDSRLVVYGPHPEYEIVENGIIKEYPSSFKHRPAYGPWRYTYTCFGNSLGFYNWQVVRRSAAWAGKIPNQDLPVIN